MSDTVSMTSRLQDRASRLNPRAMTAREFRRVDRIVRTRGVRCTPRTPEEAFVFALRFPDCVGRNHPSARFLVDDASADFVITGRGRAQVNHITTGRGVWKSPSYWLNFVPRAACSWRPTAPYSGRKFPRPALP